MGCAIGLKLRSCSRRNEPQKVVRCGPKRIKPDSMNVLASLMQTMLLGFTPPARACRGTCHTLETDFRRSRRPFCYPNPGVTLGAFPSDRRHLRCRHLRDPMTDNADFSEFRNIQHWRQLLRRMFEPLPNATDNPILRA